MKKALILSMLLFAFSMTSFARTFQLTDGTTMKGNLVSSNSNSIFIEDERGNLTILPRDKFKPEIVNTNQGATDAGKNPASSFKGKVFLSIQPNLLIHGAAIGFEFSENFDMGLLVDYGTYNYSSSGGYYGTYSISMNALMLSLMTRIKFGTGPLKPYLGLSGGIPLFKNSSSSYSGSTTEDTFIRDVFLVIGRAGFGADYRINEYISVSGEYGLQGGLYIYSSSGVQTANLGFTYAAAAVNFYF